MAAFSSHTDKSIDALLQHLVPAAQAAGSVSHCQGLSGGSWRLEQGGHTYGLREALASSPPGVSLARQYRVLKSVAQGIGPKPIGLYQGWLLAEWLPGDVCLEMPPAAAMSQLAYQLHHRPLLGWQNTFVPLLEFYWLNADPRRRTVAWLRLLRQMQHQGQPRPLRLAPLHMDLHPGNILQQRSSYRLLDWEYAADGDVALELATLVTQYDNPAPLLESYADLARIPLIQLTTQVGRWQPWLMILMASWYEWRWQQTGEQPFTILANDAWRRLHTK